MSTSEGLHLPPLPYAAEALAPAIGAGTVSVHYRQIFGAHRDALRILLDGHPSLAKKSAEELLCARSLPARDAAEIRWHAGAVFAHTLYFSSMRPPVGGYAEPLGELACLIRRDIGSYGELCFRFREAALAIRGVGFLYLVLTPRGDRVRLLACRDTGVPSSAEGKPLLCMDLWEHAYYLDYAADRAAAVNAFLSVLDWEAAERRLQDLLGKITNGK